MKIVKVSIVSAIVASLLASVATAGEFSVGVDYSRVEMKGNVQYKGTDIDTKSTLGITKKKSTVIPEIRYTTGDHLFKLNYTGTKFEGTNTLTSAITFNNVVYAAGTTVNSYIDTDWYILGYRYNMNPLERLDLALGADLHIVDFEAQIAAPVANIVEKYDITFPLPTVAADIKYNIYDNFNLIASASGMTLGKYGNYKEFAGGVSIDCKLVDNMMINAGYKSKSFNLKDKSDERFDIKWDVWYAGLAYRF